jgi:hypothetical protein
VAAGPVPSPCSAQRICPRPPCPGPAPCPLPPALPPPHCMCAPVCCVYPRQLLAVAAAVVAGALSAGALGCGSLASYAARAAFVCAAAAVAAAAPCLVMQSQATGGAQKNTDSDSGGTGRDRAVLEPGNDLLQVGVLARGGCMSAGMQGRGRRKQARAFARATTAAGMLLACGLRGVVARRSFEASLLGSRTPRSCTIGLLVPTHARSGAPVR